MGFSTEFDGQHLILYCLFGDCAAKPMFVEITAIFGVILQAYQKNHDDVIFTKSSIHHINSAFDNSFSIGIFLKTSKIEALDPHDEIVAETHPIIEHNFVPFVGFVYEIYYDIALVGFEGEHVPVYEVAGLG